MSKDTTVKEISQELEKLLNSSGAARASIGVGLKNGNKLIITLVEKDEVEAFEAWIDRYDEVPDEA